MSRSTMQTRSMTRKRKRSPNPTANDNDNNNDQNNNDNSNNQNDSNSNEPPTKKQKTSSNNNENKNVNHNNTNSLQVIQLSAYYCCVCKELTSDKIFQCLNGHLICNECYSQLKPCKCPTCRIQMDKLNPIRNRMAEDTLSFRIAKCRYEGCNHKSIFSKLKIHQNNECVYKPTICKFASLGCEWKGFMKNKNEHEMNCKLDQDKLLEMFQNLHVYQRFCRKSAEIERQSLSLYYPRNTIVFADMERVEIYFYDFPIRVKTKVASKQINDEEFVEFYARVELEEYDEPSDNLQVNIGIVLDIDNDDDVDNCHVGNLEIKATLNHENKESEWLRFGKQFQKQEYMSLFHPDSSACSLQIVVFQFD